MLCYNNTTVQHATKQRDTHDYEEVQTDVSEHSESRDDEPLPDEPDHDPRHRGVPRADSTYFLVPEFLYSAFMNVT